MVLYLCGGHDDEMEPPFPRLEVDLSREDLCETAYEVLVYSCLSSHGRRRRRLFMRKVVGSNGSVEALLAVARTQMDISKQRDSELRKVFFTKAATKTKEIEVPKVVPLELLLHISPSGFSTLKVYGKWRRRQLKLLEAGLLVYPSTIHPDSENLGPFLKKEITGLWDYKQPRSARMEAFQELRSAANWLAGEECNWANAYPLNVHIYDVLLWSLFSSTGNMRSTICFEMDQALFLARKTWGVLGIGQSMHHVCFAWVLFSKFEASGDKELLDLLLEEMKQAERLLRLDGASVQSDLFSSVLERIQRWSEIRLYAYHGFKLGDDSKDVLHYLIDMSLLANDFLGTCVTASSKVQHYIQTSLRLSFSQVFNGFSNHGKLSVASISSLAEAVFALAATEQHSFSPLFERWHPCPAEVAISTLHRCFKRELKQFLLGNVQICDVVQALRSAATLESELKSLLPLEDMFRNSSFASNATVFEALRRWLRDNFLELNQWVDFQEETYGTLSGVLYMRFIEEILDALFGMPLYGRPEILQEFIFGVESTAEHFVFIGRKHTTSVPEENCTPSPLDRIIRACKATSEKVWSELTDMDNSGTSQRASPDIQDSCRRLNTILYVQYGLQGLQDKLKQLKLQVGPKAADKDFSLENATQYCREGIEKLCDGAAQKMVFYYMVNAGAWEAIRRCDGVEVALRFLRNELGTISESVTAAQIRSYLLQQVMEKCFEAFAEVVEVQEEEHRHHSSGFLKAFMDYFKTGLDESLVDESARPLLDLMNEKCISSSSKTLSMVISFKQQVADKKRALVMSGGSKLLQTLLSKM